MKSQAKCYDELREYIATLSIIDCHDHAGEKGKVTDVLAHLAQSYYGSDLMSASNVEDVLRVQDAGAPLEERWKLFEKAYGRSRLTGYGLCTRMAVEKVFGETEITLASLKRMQEKLPDFSDEKVYYSFYDDARIVARIANIDPPLSEGDVPGLGDIMSGTYKGLRDQHLAIRLPYLHAITTRSEIERVERAVGRTVTSLDEYEEACREIFEAYVRVGAVCFKDQSAYSRNITYGNPTRAEAEAVFNRILADPRYRAEYPVEGNSLSDFLMHSFMRAARDMDLPVQIHTGHMAGIRNDVAKANAAGLRSLVEIHQDVRFDIFHGNWPYAGDLLFLVKNHPNVYMDMCWVHIVDPLYARDLLKQAVSSVPHGKIHGFGSDVGGGEPDYAWAHAEMAKDNIATSLSELVEIGHIGLDEAREVAVDILFNNPNEFFRLGLARQ